MESLDWRSEIEYVQSENGCVLTAYRGGNDQVILPDSIDGVPVTEIGPYAFAHRGDITQVRIPFGARE